MITSVTQVVLSRENMRAADAANEPSRVSSRVEGSHGLAHGSGGRTRSLDSAALRTAPLGMTPKSMGGSEAVRSLHSGMTLAG